MNKPSGFQKNVSWAGKELDDSNELNLTNFKDKELIENKDEFQVNVMDHRDNSKNSEAEIKNTQISKRIFGLFKFLLELAKKETDVANLSTGKRSLFDDIVNNKKGPIEAEPMISFIEELFDKIIKAKKGTIDQLEKRSQSSNANYDELLHRLEEEVQRAIKKEEKLNLFIETAQMRIDDLEKIISEQEKTIQRLVNDKKSVEREMKANKNQFNNEIESLQKEIDYLNAKFRKTEVTALEKQIEAGGGERLSKILSPNSEGKFFPRPQTDTFRSTASETGFPRKNVQNFFVEKEYQEIYNEVLGKGGELTHSKDNLKLINQLINNKKQSEFDRQKYKYHISKMAIQVEQKTRDLGRMDRNYNDLKKDVIKTKEIMYEQEKTRWGREINSDKNPNLIDYYKKEIDKKEKRILELEKKTKKFAIFEKKLLVKEKAFENERSGYHDKLHFLNDRIHDLTNYIENNKNTTKDVNLYKNYTRQSSNGKPFEKEQSQK